MKRTFRQDKATGKFVEVTRERVSRGTMIQPDIEPYESIVTGETITSRSKHREHLRMHGMQEVGDQQPAFLKDKYEREHQRPEWGRDGRRIDTD